MKTKRCYHNLLFKKQEGPICESSSGTLASYSAQRLEFCSAIFVRGFKQKAENCRINV